MADDVAGRPGGRVSRHGLAVILGVGAVVRLGYVLAQPAVDPTFARPALDAARYVAWARGEAVVDGAYYLAPGYAWFLGGLFAVFGERFAVVYLVQHALVLVSAWIAAKIVERTAGRIAGWATAALIVASGPLLFFASRPLGEVVAILALLVAIDSATRDRLPHSLASGVLSGLAALARPNLLAVPVLWTAVLVLRRRWRLALATVAAVAVVLVPTTLRNHRASGHWVPVSSNAGITLYQGNGPGATGAFTPVAGMTGDIAGQRREATRLAREATGDPDLDPVEADRWWMGEAWTARLADPAGTLELLARRALLTVASREIGVDETPRIDDNPWRHGAPVPFWLLFGLAAAGVAAGGFRRTGGAVVWTAIAATAATTVAFYVSARYRLPLTALLAIPAGVGVVALVRPSSVDATDRRRVAVVALLAAVVLAWSAPSAELSRSADAIALANRGSSWLHLGRSEEAGRDLRRATTLDPEAPQPWFNLGVAFERNGRIADAIEAYERAATLDPAHGQALANLGGAWVRAGRPDRAIAPLERAVAVRPDLRPGWTNLVVARYATGDVEAARAGARAASRAGVVLAPELLRQIERPPEGQ